MLTAAPMTAGPYSAPFKRGYGDAFAIPVALLRPESRGRITLRSTDPSAAPIIVQNVLSTESDRVTLRAGWRVAKKVGRQAPIRKYVASELAPLGFSDSDLDEHIQSTGFQFIIRLEHAKWVLRTTRERRGPTTEGAWC